MDVYLYIPFKIWKNSELFIEKTEVEEVRDAVLVTDGDSEIGQVCVAFEPNCLLTYE